jgi:hypothetical protein
MYRITETPRGEWEVQVMIHAKGWVRQYSGTISDCYAFVKLRNANHIEFPH